MTDSAPQFTDFRVLYQWREQTEEGVVLEHYEFTTVLALDAEQAAATLASAGYHDQDDEFEVVQVVEANDFQTGYPHPETIATESETPVYDELAAEQREDGGS